MRALIQRVKQAKVKVEGENIAAIERGFLVFLGIKEDDNAEIAEKLWKKIGNLRIFENHEGKTNLALADVGGEVLIISQFTLYADCRKGNRPSFSRAGSAATSKKLYDLFIQMAEQSDIMVKTGIFGADMKISLVNDGPFTVMLDTEELMMEGK